MSALLLRALIFALIWWALTEGRADGWGMGLVFVALAVAASLRVWPPGPHRLSPTGLLRYAGFFHLAAARQEALQRLQALADDLGLRPGEARLLARHGEAARVILREELEQDCDLVCLGKHGRGMLEELLLGSVTKHVQAESVGDVLVVGSAGQVCGPDTLAG